MDITIYAFEKAVVLDPLSRQGGCYEYTLSGRNRAYSSSKYDLVRTTHENYSI